MKNYTLLFFSFFTIIGFSQARNFETIIDLDATDVISQGKTGTCWSFSASSFLESEIMRITGKKIDISEMYNVRHTYPKKAWIYVMRQGKAQLSEGGLAHDVMNSISENGLMPNTFYTGLKANEEGHNHSKLVDTLKTVLNAYLKDSSLDWKTSVNHILDDKLGKSVSSFTYENKTYTPQTFMDYVKINPDNYVTLTSFKHQPYYKSFILNIPDNFSNGTFYNVSLKELTETVNQALKNGYTVELDCDVSEKTFSSKYGLAVIPEDNIDKKIALTSITPEKNITPEFRQQEFENFNTTDDHLMHITGLLKDQNGTIYYKVKNSWGNNSNRIGNDGYIYMSEAYFKLKTISVMVHKEAIPKTIRKNLKL